MTNQHPITPPFEIMDQWCMDFYELGSWRDIAIKAAHWGADQELEATLELMETLNIRGVEYIRNVRRPKPPSLKAQALIEFNSLLGDSKDEGAAIILRALETMPDNTSPQS
jgi:hypothetical protein